MKIAYTMSRFPKLTETFILNEILAMQAAGVPVEIYPLQRERAAKMHPQAKALVAQAHFTPLLSWPILKANLKQAIRRPGLYFGTLAGLVRHTLGSRRFLLGALAFFPKSVYLAEKMKADGITHLHAHFASHPALAAYTIGRLAGIPYSFTAHGSDIHRDRHMLAEKVSQAAFVVPISEFNRQVILEATGGKFAEKMKIVHCGVDTQRFEATPAELNGNHRSFELVCVGTLHEVKGQTHLLEACRLLQEQGINFICHFVGDGPDRQALEKQAGAAGLLGKVRFHGHLSQGEVLEILHQVDVLVAPSVPSSDGRREGIPMVLMEGMAVGLPVVSSRLSGIPELVTDGQEGLLTEPGDAPALAEALAALAASPELRRRLGQNGRRKVEREFDLHVNARRLANLFQEGLKDRAGA